MADMEPGADPWLDVERRETQYPGGATPNAQNTKTRADTYGIRPDIYEQLSNVITKKVTVDKLLEDARKALEQAAALNAEQAVINERLIDINEDQKGNVAEQKRLQGLIDGLKSQYDAAVAELDGLNDDLRDLNSRIESKIGDAGDITERIKTLNAQTTKLINDQGVLNSALDQTNSDLKNLTGVAKPLADRISGVSQTLEQRTGAQGTLITQMASNLAAAKKYADDADSVIEGTMSTLRSDLESRTGATGTLTTKLNNAATQAQYNALNTRLWGEQGELNKVNNALWDSQSSLNVNLQKGVAALTKAQAMDAKLWGEQGELNRLNTELWNAQSPLNKKLLAFTEMQTKWNDTQTGWNAKQDAINDINRTMWDEQTGWNKTIQAALQMQAEWNDTQTGWNAKQDQLSRLNGEMWDSQSNLNKKLTAFTEMQTQWNDEQIGWNEKQKQINKALTTSGTANTRAINLLYVQNHGSLYMTEADAFVLSGGSWQRFTWSGQRGDMLGCHLSATKSTLFLDSPGDWQITARVLFPPGSTGLIGSTRTKLSITAYSSETTEAITQSNNDGYSETLTVSMVVKAAGITTVSVSGYASNTSGAMGWMADTGPAVTEFTARQLSRDSEIK